jgi:spore maturation protein CgeB
MRQHMRDVLFDRELADSLTRHGLQTILERHTCAHRVDQLLQIMRGLNTAEQAIRAEQTSQAARA